MSGGWLGLQEVLISLSVKMSVSADDADVRYILAQACMYVCCRAISLYRFLLPGAVS